jgi:hypothetical protein
MVTHVCNSKGIACRLGTWLKSQRSCKIFACSKAKTALTLESANTVLTGLRHHNRRSCYCDHAFQCVHVMGVCCACVNI